jgi:hypothetical protein
MRQIFMMVLVGLVISGPVRGADASGGYTLVSVPTCGEYLGSYSDATLKDAFAYTGGHKAWRDFGWIDGYITATNKYINNGKKNILDSISVNDTRRWLASWCRDNPSGNIGRGLVDFLSKLK